MTIINLKCGGVHKVLCASSIASSRQSLSSGVSLCCFRVPSVQAGQNSKSWFIQQLGIN